MPTLSSDLGHIDVRDAFFDEVCRAAESDHNIIVLSDDQGSFSLNKLRKKHPDQYINLGIAEQNAIDLAAGLALGGMRPIVYGITNFVSLRCAEQISVSLSLMRLPVVIVASGGGLTYASDGPTHHATQDVALLRSMPGMTIFNPADAASTAAAARMSLAAASPCYIRLEKGIQPTLYADSHDFSAGFDLVRQGGDALIVSTGFATHLAIGLADSLCSSGIRPAVLDLYRLKPLDRPRIAASLQSAKVIVTIEEQGPTGGVFTIVAEILADYGIARPVKHFNLPDEPCYRYGSREWLHNEFSISIAAMRSDLASFFSQCARKD